MPYSFRNHHKNIKMAKSILHKANTRGHADHGWLNSYHSFSFAGYYNPERMNFGALRVLNDDTVAGGRGFSTHPHDNMEIISIPLEGDLEHKDNMGTLAVIKQGDIQSMTAGTGVQHSEKNKNMDAVVKFLQIWVVPNKRNVVPKYNQITTDLDGHKNIFQQIVSPVGENEGVQIQQNAWFNLGKFDKGISTDYTIHSAQNGVYAFIISGSAEINGTKLEQRDGLGIWETNTLSIKTQTEDTQILLMEVPM